MAETTRQIEDGPVPTAHKEGRQMKTYNIVCIFIMAFASIAMGYSASIIATTLGKSLLSTETHERLLTHLQLSQHSSHTSGS